MKTGLIIFLAVAVVVGIVVQNYIATENYVKEIKTIYEGMLKNRKEQVAYYQDLVNKLNQVNNELNAYNKVLLQELSHHKPGKIDFPNT